MKIKIKEALILEDKFHFRKTPLDPKDMKQIIIPRKEDNAITIREIEKKTERLQKKLKKP